MSPRPGAWSHLGVLTLGAFFGLVGFAFSVLVSVVLTTAAARSCEASGGEGSHGKNRDCEGDQLFHE